jgi:peptidoglycan/LPS O-acetylase OafA/YrhL
MWVRARVCKLPSNRTLPFLLCSACGKPYLAGMLVHVLFEMRRASGIASGGGGGGGGNGGNGCNGRGGESGAVTAGGADESGSAATATSTAATAAAAATATAAAASVYPLAACWPLNPKAPTRWSHRLLHGLAAAVWAWTSWAGDGTDQLRDAPSHFGRGSTFNAAAIITSQTLYGSCVAYGLLLCLVGRAEWLSRLLSLDVWVPFARLSYSAYLLQFVCIDALVPVVGLGDGDSSAAALGKWLVLVVASTAGTFALSAVTFVGIEQPCIALR